MTAATKGQRLVIVGGGISGLTLADAWTGRGQPAVVLEKERALGGLCRSIAIGDDHYDLGPHRFFSHDDSVCQFVHELMGEGLTAVSRTTAIHLFNGYHRWPPSWSTLWSLPTSFLVSVGLDLVKAALAGRPSTANCLQYIEQRYGPTLLEHFFRPLNEKFVHRRLEEIHVDWVRHGVDLSVIDKGDGQGLISYCLSRLLWPRTGLRFWYPRSGGIAAMVTALRQRAHQQGARFVTDCTVDGLTVDKGAVTSLHCADGTTVSGDLFVWTAPLDELRQRLGGSTRPLETLSTWFHYFRLRQRPPRREQWIYVPDKDRRLARLTVPSNLYEPTRTSMTVVGTEATAAETKSSAADISAELRRDLLALRLIDSPADILEEQSICGANSYPVYGCQYRHDVEAAAAVVTKPDNLFVLGRNGLFWYNNIDACIATALEMATWLTEAKDLPSPAEKMNWVMTRRFPQAR